MRLPCFFQTNFAKVYVFPSHFYISINCNRKRNFFEARRDGTDLRPFCSIAIRAPYQRYQFGSLRYILRQGLSASSRFYRIRSSTSSTS
eukprot:g82636.t1